MSNFKVGDRVKVADNVWVRTRHLGKLGTVSAAVGHILFIRFDDETCDSARARDLQLLPKTLDIETLDTDLKALHGLLITLPALSAPTLLEAVITKHFGVVWKSLQDGRWVEKEYAE